VGWVYLAAALPLCSFALRAFGRAAREPDAASARRYFALGVVLAAFGIDALRVLHRLTSAHPSPLALLPLVLIGGALVYVGIREWTRLARERPGARAKVLAAQREAELEALTAEAESAPPAP
tara:strand:+ start:1731 stop:2096 length:366 start_codon:yes stop_codon:yes gene_type:complete